MVQGGEGRRRRGRMSVEVFIEKLFTVVISAGVGWLVSAATKVSNSKLEKTISELEKRVISPVVLRVERLEAKAEGFVTRNEMKEVVAELKSSIESRQVEIRGTIKGIFSELRDLRERRGVYSHDEE
jgi:hypothetical protein